MCSLQGNLQDTALFSTSWALHEQHFYLTVAQQHQFRPRQCTRNTFYSPGGKNFNAVQIKRDASLIIHNYKITNHSFLIIKRETSEISNFTCSLFFFNIGFWNIKIVAVQMFWWLAFSEILYFLFVLIFSMLMYHFQKFHQSNFLKFWFFRHF